MDKLKNLQIRKLLKELDYFETAHEYTNEIITEYDSEFVKSMNEFLEKNPELKKIYDKKNDERLQAEINMKKRRAEELEKKRKEEESKEEQEINLDDENVDVEEDIDDIEDTIKKPEPSKKIKKLYREIVKLTHPDKVDDKELNDIYIEATDFYNKNDKLGIYKVCSDLNIFYDLDEEDDAIILRKISKLKNEISFMESTYTWKWFNSPTDEEKEKLLRAFINMKISGRVACGI